MFTDDCTMFCTICDSSDTETVHVHMQQDLDNIQAWADKWKVAFTPHKYQALTITNKRQSNHCPLTFNGVTITETPTINILGVTIDQKLNWNHHINRVATGAGQNLRILRIVGQPTAEGVQRFKKTAHHIFSRATRDGQEMLASQQSPHLTNELKKITT
eukprot:g23341.t1